MTSEPGLQAADLKHQVKEALANKERLTLEKIGLEVELESQQKRCEQERLELKRHGMSQPDEIDLSCLRAELAARKELAEGALAESRRKIAEAEASLSAASEAAAEHRAAAADRRKAFELLGRPSEVPEPMSVLEEARAARLVAAESLEAVREEVERKAQYEEDLAAPASIGPSVVADSEVSEDILRFDFALDGEALKRSCEEHDGVTHAEGSEVGGTCVPPAAARVPVAAPADFEIHAARPAPGDLQLLLRLGARHLERLERQRQTLGSQRLEQESQSHMTDVTTYMFDEVSCDKLSDGSFEFLKFTSSTVQIQGTEKGLEGKYRTQLSPPRRRSESPPPRGRSGTGGLSFVSPSREPVTSTEDLAKAYQSDEASPRLVRPEPSATRDSALALALERSQDHIEALQRERDEAGERQRERERVDSSCTNCCTEL
ncbi:unnamed protein product [Symbiodinium sp. CCMP2592]|nr:unnamed protein product [Symbiodinium sp. CCMP2592]